MGRGGRTQRTTLVGVLLVVAVTLGFAGCISPPKQQAAIPPAQIQPAPSPTPAPAPAPSPAPVPEVTGKLIVRFLDIGQGDSCFISLPDGKTMLVDVGPTAAGDSVVNYIKGLGAKKLDYVIFTHPHEDHIGGAVAVLKAFDIGQVYMPRTSHTTQTYEDLLNAIDAKGLTVTEAKAGKVITNLANLKAVLIGPGQSYEDLNDWSAVLSLKYGEKTFLFEGDASTKAEGAMLVSSECPMRTY